MLLDIDEDNKEILLIRSKYIVTIQETGFMMKLWNTIKKSSKKHNRINDSSRL
jgi:hypothetical protein